MTTRYYALANALISASERIDFAGWLYATTALDLALRTGGYAPAWPADSRLALATLPVYDEGGAFAAPQDLPAMILRNGGHVPNASLSDYSLIQRVEMAIFQVATKRMLPEIEAQETAAANDLTTPLMDQLSHLKLA